MQNVLEYLDSAVQQFPNKVAIAMKEENYTFSQLKNLSRRLAAQIPCNIRKSPIIVFANRQANVAILFLATLYSGNFYVPVDPDMPYEKIQAIIDDARPRVILGDDETRNLLSMIDFEGLFLTMQSITDKLCEYPQTEKDAPLYMVYTSGSTGKPKGVLKSHGAVISYMEAYCDTFGFANDDIIGNQTPFFFDASAKDFYLMLKTGATIEIIPTELFSMPPMLVEYLNEKKITFISWVPTALSIVAQLRTFTYVLPTTLRKVFFVGEVMPMKHLNKWRQALPQLEYVNLYGSSEIAGISCYYVVQGQFEDSDVLPMGHPLSNCKIYLIDDDKIVTESNHIGEIFVVSDALALEYYHDIEKTSECFLQKDFGEGIVRCFKTGDLAQYDDDGNLVFASRVDYQIKHMGHRIELGEIEAVANSLPEIQRCCCLYDNKKSKIVLLCEITRECESITGQQIQSLLRPKLSSYMLPSRVIKMDELPLNANGKIDRQALKLQI